MRKLNYSDLLRDRFRIILIKILTKQLCRMYRVTSRLCYGCIRAEQDIEDRLCMMFHNESESDGKPLLPKRWDSLFDNEAGSDVVFLVGTEPDTWRFPGHSSILRNNPVFKAMLEGPFANTESKIVIQDVDGRAFDHLLRYLYHEDVQLQSVGTALMTLYAANKYLCPDLVEICVKYLDEHITTDTVLQIYEHLRVYSTDLNTDSESDLLGFPSAPPQEQVEEQAACSTVEKKGRSMSQWCTLLLYNCYHYIDLHADEVLSEESVEDLTKDALYDIAKRDTLGISSECILFSVVEKWCNRECKRCQLELSDDNRKAILGDRLLFSVRYLLMTSEEFLSGPMRSGLFEQMETAMVLGIILKHPASCESARITPQVINFLKRARRKESYAPIPLSARTKRIVTSPVKPLVANKIVSKKEKKKKKDDEDRQSKCLGYSLSVLACIFD